MNLVNQVERLVAAFESLAKSHESIAESLWKLSSCVEPSSTGGTSHFDVYNSVYLDGVSDDAELHGAIQVNLTRLTGQIE